MTGDAWRRGSIGAVLLLLLSLPIARSADAASGGADGWVHAPATPVQLAFSPPGLQVFDYATPVYGLRLSLLYGSQISITGLDLGLFSDAKKLNGVQLGLGNQVFGAMNGIQVGVANSADDGTGVQLGLWNRSHGLRGLQIGLINWHDEGFLPVFPFFNFAVGHDAH